MMAQFAIVQKDAKSGHEEIATGLMSRNLSTARNKGFSALVEPYLRRDDKDSGAWDLGPIESHHL